MRRVSAPRSPRRSSSFLERIFDWLAMDRFLSAAIAAFLAIAVLLSLVAGVAIWPVAHSLRSNASVLGEMCRHVTTMGWLTTAVCAVFAVFLMVWQRGQYSAGRIFAVNLLLFWGVATVVLLGQNGLISQVMGSFMGTLLWTLTSCFLGYVLAVAPVLLVTGVVSLAHMVLDLILPE